MKNFITEEIFIIKILYLDSFFCVDYYNIKYYKERGPLTFVRYGNHLDRNDIDDE